jgi:hypothetical protein
MGRLSTKTPPGLREPGRGFSDFQRRDGRGKVMKTMQVVRVGSTQSKKSPDRGLLGRGSRWQYEECRPEAYGLTLLRRQAPDKGIF